MTDFLLMEDGSYLLQENGSKIILEQPVVTTAAAPARRGGYIRHRRRSPNFIYDEEKPKPVILVEPDLYIT